MWNSLGAFWRLFQKGQAVANPEAWKKGQIGVTVLAPFLLAITESARALGYDIPLTTEQAVAIAGGIIAVVNVVLTITTTDKVGLGSAPAAQPDRGGSIDAGGVSVRPEVRRDAVAANEPAKPVPNQDPGGSRYGANIPGHNGDINGG